MVRKSLVQIVCGVLASVSAGAAWAENAPSAVHVEVRRGQSCVSTKQLLQEVKRREPSAKVGMQGAADTSIRFEFETDPQPSMLFVKLDARGQTLERRVVAASCAELLEAAVFVVLVAAEHQAAFHAELWKREPEAQQEVHETTLSAGVFGWTVLNGTWGASLALERDFNPGVLRIELGRSLRERVGVDGGDVYLTWSELRLSGCFRALTLAGAAALMPCANVDVGGVEAHAEALNQANTLWRPWLALGPSARLRTALGNWRLNTELGLGLPLVRDEFAVAKNRAAYRLPNAYFQVALALGVVF